MAKKVYLKLKPRISISNLSMKIEKKFIVKKTNNLRSTSTYLDTFDWRLYRNNLILRYENKFLRLEDFESQQNQLNMEISTIPVLINDFAKSELKNAIKKIVQMRALLNIAEVVVHKTEYNLLNKNEKIVLQMRIDSINGVGRFISIQSLRGYSNQMGIFKSLIKSHVEETNQRTIINDILKNNKKQPADYDPRINVQLQPQMQSSTALKLILKNLVETMVKNEQGIIEDIDTEFTHDFRVASRRTRAALTQIKNIFIPEITDKYNNQFTQLGKKTNKLRDLDVYLLNKEKYINRLPKNMRSDLEPFFENLQKERKTEVRKFIRFLKSDSYKKQVKEYLNFLTVKNLKTDKDFNAVKPIISLATEFIINQYNKMLKLGNKIKPDSPDALYHKLRIQCKKFRYLLEFFSSLFPKEKITVLIAHLKKLQDNLGSFNDLFVQQETLKEYSNKDEFNSNVILSLGYLIGKLNDEQIAVKNEFQNVYRKFMGSKNKKLFTELFLKHNENK